MSHLQSVFCARELKFPLNLFIASVFLLKKLLNKGYILSMSKDNILNFNNEFRKIDGFIDGKLYRDAGCACGYMLEYMLLKICKELKAHAGHELSMKLNHLIKNIAKGTELDKFCLGEMIELINKQDPLKENESSKQSRILLSVACRILEEDNCKNVARINFSSYPKIRNNCVHPYKPTPSLRDIKLFRSTLKALSLEFKKTFSVEYGLNHESIYFPYFLIIIAVILSISASVVSLYMLKTVMEL